ncbi:MAG: HD-GYP domain-containing protein [Desulfovibrio sp.]|jgi:HD-GYP domain-containing protein (c-di-GMP phosphodiesterase class II)|nr:HD-GYP domain-containing protein [Desulfovibrio sp.]
MSGSKNNHSKTLRHIHVSELKPGMYVVDAGITWASRPYLYMKEGLITTEEQARRIADEGYLESYIDLTRSTRKFEVTPFKETFNLEETEKPFLFKPRVPLAEEVSAAAEVHDDTVGYVRNFMSDIRTGKLDMAPAFDFMGKIMASMERNVNAMLSLCRLRRVDSYTYMHCVNVSVFSSMFSRYLGMGENKALCLGLSGLFHDLGKALVPAQILNAPRKLNPEERALMNSHPTLGYEQIKDIPGITPEVPLGMLHHHEKYNGSGYPSGLSGDSVSKTGYIIALADVYDALTSKRVYKDGMTPHQALGIMYEEMRGRDLHPELLNKFIKMLGVYPIGSVVEMSDGSWGVVSGCNVDAPIKPVVTLVRDAQGHAVPETDVDLSAADVQLSIKRCVPAETTNINPAQVLRLPPGAPEHNC